MGGLFVVNYMSINIVPLLLLLLIVREIVVWRRRPGWHVLFEFLFGCYLLKVVELVWFPINISGSYADTLRQDPHWGEYINFIPFYFGRYGLTEHGLVEIAQNILLTMPFGFGLSFVSHRKGRDFWWIALAVGLGIEAVQLFISLLLRYPYRVITVNDAIFNTAGVLLGYGCFMIFAYLYRAFARRFTAISSSGICAYVREVAFRAVESGQ